MEKTTVLVWFELFEQLLRLDYEERSERIDNLFSEADIVYAYSGNSYQNACERTYSSKVRKLPAYINNDEALKEYVKENVPGDDDSIEVLAPLDVLAKIVGKAMSELEDMLGEDSSWGEGADMLGMSGDKDTKPINIADMSEEELDKKLPSPIANAFKGLNQAIQETSQMAHSILEEYMGACSLEGIDEKQAKDEGESYLGSEGKIPAAEFICPVSILDKLKNI